jgi:hypothetical protein
MNISYLVLVYVRCSKLLCQVGYIEHNGDESPKANTFLLQELPTAVARLKRAQVS